MIVDEPTAGLDPGERNRFYNLLSEIGEKVIVILSTHIVQDVMEFVHVNMAIVHQGRGAFCRVRLRARVQTLQGAIWKRFVAKADYDEYARNYRVISSKLLSGRPLIHIFSAEAPGNGFEPRSARSRRRILHQEISGLS